MKTHRSCMGFANAKATNTARLTRRTIFRALSGVLGTATWIATGIAEPAFGASSDPTSPQAPQNWPVQTCDDVAQNTGSLRAIASTANSGDTIDFSQLPTLCGMADSTITLTAGDIVLHQPNITLLGPAPGTGTVTISAGGASRVLRHKTYSPSGTLAISNLRISDGYVHDSGDVSGGCIYSDTSVQVTQTVVSNCVARSESGNAHGGGIYVAAQNQLSLVLSTITGSSAEVGSDNASAEGGGVHSDTFNSKYSEIVANRATGTSSACFCAGGGVHARYATVRYSTIAENEAALGGGMLVFAGGAGSTILNSTLSGNHSSGRGGAIYANEPTLDLANTTIAFNTTDAAHGGGIYFNFNGGSVDLESTIVGKNASAVPADGADLYVKSGTLTGASNLIMSSNTNPQSVIVSTSDPLLAPLAWAGGVTRTHMLLPGSPSIGLGNNNGNRTRDQRGPGYPRTTGPSASVDIGAVQFDTIFVSGFDF